MSGAAQFLREAPIKRLQKWLRETWDGTHDTLVRRQFKEDPHAALAAVDSGAICGRSRGSSDKDEAIALPEEVFEIPRRWSELSNRSAPVESLLLPITPNLLETFTDLTKCSQRVKNLKGRLNEAELKHLRFEMELDNVRPDFEESSGVEEDHPQNRRNAAFRKLAKADEHCQNVIEKLTSSIRARECFLSFTREQLEAGLLELLGPHILTTNGDAESDLSEEDFANQEATEADGDMDIDLERAESPRPGSVVDVDINAEARYTSATNRTLAKQQLYNINNEFEWHFTSYDAQLEEYQNLVEAGECGLSLSEWQLEQLLLGQRYTRAVVAAEAAYSEAATEARRLGAIELSVDQSSRFADDSVDGNEVDDEINYSVVRTNMSAIERWYDKLEDGSMSSLDDEEIEGMSHLDSIMVDESPHQRAGGRERKRIDRWNLERVRRWEEMLDQDYMKPLRSRKPSTIDAIEVHELAGNEAEGGAR